MPTPQEIERLINQEQAASRKAAAAKYPQTYPQAPAQGQRVPPLQQRRVVQQQPQQRPQQRPPVNRNLPAPIQHTRQMQRPPQSAALSKQQIQEQKMFLEQKRKKAAIIARHKQEIIYQQQEEPAKYEPDIDPNLETRKVILMARLKGLRAEAEMIVRLIQECDTEMEIIDNGPPEEEYYEEEYPHEEYYDDGYYEEEDPRVNSFYEQ